MKCKRCGLNYFEGEIACRRCGFPLPEKNSLPQSQDVAKSQVTGPQGLAGEESQIKSAKNKNLGIVSICLSALALLFALTIYLEFNFQFQIFSPVLLQYFLITLLAVSVVSSISSLFIVFIIKKSGFTAMVSICLIFSIIALVIAIYALPQIL